MKNIAHKGKKNDKLEYTRIRNFCSLKDTSKKVKKQPRDYNKILSRSISKRDLFPHYRQIPANQLKAVP